MLQGQPDVLAVLVSSTTTQTVTSYITLTETGETTQYGTITQLTNVQTVTGSTFTTTGVTTVLVQTLTTAVYPVTVKTQTAGSTCSGDPPQCIGWAKVIFVTYYVPTTGYVMGYAQSTVYGTVTSQYVTNVPTTLFSTSASTSTYATGQVVAVTATQTLTSVSEQAGPSISDMLSQNLWIIIVLGVVVLVVLAFRLGRRGGTGPSRVSPLAQTVQGPKSGTVYCRSCGTQNPAANEFCGKCGTKL
jgi:hypothetical protein